MAAGIRTIMTRFLGDSKGIVDASNDGAKAIAGWQKGVANASKAILASTALIGAGLLKVGSQFDDAYDTIRLTTGKSGAALDGLEADFKAVAKTVPASLGDVSTALAQLNQRTGQTGDALQELTRTELLLAKLTGGDISSIIASTTRVFGDWSIKTTDQVKALNELYRASQATGISVDGLSQTVVQFGAPLRQLGFTFEQSISLLAKWEKEGVNTELVLGGLKKALGAAAKAGKDPVKALNDLEAAIAGAGSTAKANAIAVDALGVKAGPDFAAAVREGRLAFGDLLDTVTNGTETIATAEDATADFSEKLQQLKNRALIAIEPAANAVFDAFNKGTNQLERFGAWAEKNQGIVRNLAIGLAGAAAALVVLNYLIKAWVIITKVATAVQIAFNIALDANIIGLIIIAIVALVAALVLAYKKVGWFRAAVDATWKAIKIGAEAIGKAAVWLWKNAIVPAFNGIVAAIKWIATAATWLWTNVLKPTFNFIAAAVKVAFAVFMWVGANIFVPFVNIAKAVFSSVENFIRSLINLVLWMGEVVFGPIFRFIGAIISYVWTNQVQPALAAFQKALGWIGDAATWLWTNAIKPALDGIAAGWSWLYEHVIVPVALKIQSIFHAIGSAVSGLWDGLAGGVSTAFDKAVSVVKGAINSLIDLVNKAINFLNSNVIDNLNHVPGVTFGHIPNLPRLALGGQATRGRDYLVGENGPEILSMGGRSGHVTSNGDAFTGTQYFTITIGNKEVKDYVVEVQDDRDRRTKRRVTAGSGSR